MSNIASIDPTKLQVLVNLGSRFVVFGSAEKLPQRIHFNPSEFVAAPHVSKDKGLLGSSIVDTLQVFGMRREVLQSSDDGFADIGLVDESGHHILIECKVRESEPKRRDFESGLDHLNRARSEGKDLEVWFFNVERLKIKVMWLGESGSQYHDLVPLNVWERSSDGVFERQSVVDEVDDWVHRVGLLYGDIREWLSGEPRFRFEDARTVTMSEETMQKFAVGDRELQILDLLAGEDVVASLVPRGLWLIGAWGRVDIITQTKTSILTARKIGTDKFEWWISPHDDHRARKPFDKTALLELVGCQ